MVITLVDSDSDADAAAWAEEFGITHPVVADINVDIYLDFIPGNSIAMPAKHLVAPGGELLIVDGSPNDGDIEGNLP